MINVDEARRLRKLIEKASKSLDDRDASTGVELYPKLTGNGALIPSGTRINWHGTLKRAAVDLWDTAENTPDAAPALWEDILFRGGIRIIPSVITSGTAFVRDELGWWGDTLYCSVYNGVNVWTPEQYPSGWEAVEV